jgi:predicted TIM-barrel fold metal-dependent hydrolase
MTTNIIDIHPHIISSDTTRYPITPLGGKRSAWSETRPVDFAGLVASMDAAGVDKAAIVHSSTTYGYNNSYLADAIAEHSDRFTGVFSVDVRTADAASQIRHWMDRGLSGLRLFAAGSTVKSDQSWIADPTTYPAWVYCQETDLPVAISMRQPALQHLFDVIKRFPKVRIVVDHLLLSPIEDGPPYRESAGLFSLAEHPNVYLKLTTNNVRRAHDGLSTPETFFGQLVRTFGSARIAWGSNFPNEEGTLVQQVHEARTALMSLSAADQHNIFCGTAMTLYPSLANGQVAH